MQNLLRSKISAKSLEVIQNAIKSTQHYENSNPHKNEDAKKFVYSEKSQETLSEIKSEFESLNQSLKENSIFPKNTEVSLKDRVHAILQTHPVKEKYEELLLPERALMIPINFKQIMRIGNALDAVLNFYKARGKAQLFEELRKSIESTYHVNFTLEIFEKLITVVPEFYVHDWVLLEKHRDFSLIIDIPADIQIVLERINENLENVEHSIKGLNGPMDVKILDKRAEILKTRLINLTAKKHEIFLSEINEISYDPFKYKTWHHLFKVHDLDIKDTMKLKEKPTIRKSIGVGEFLKMNNVKDKLVREALEEAAKISEKNMKKDGSDNLSETDGSSNNSQNETSILKGILNEDLIRKVYFL